MGNPRPPKDTTQAEYNRYYHEKGESDASNETYDPPKANILSPDWAVENKQYYNKGWQNTRDQKDGKR